VGIDEKTHPGFSNLFCFDITALSTSLTHGWAYHKIPVKKLLTNGESFYVPAKSQNDGTLKMSFKL